ncbi:MAG TPA: NfeD family protein [Prolixibacteraceae bacterium]|nr:NfeD family protein [Prolixibacteraceae bacterium]
MNFLIIIFLVILGIILLLIEFTILPGITIAGVGGFMLFIYSIYLAFTSYGTLAGFLTLAFVLIVSPLLIFYLFKGKSGKRMLLSAVITGVANEVNTDKVKIGDIGLTIGRLAPMGKIKVNSEVVEVRSNGSFIDPGVQVRIVEIKKSLITVEPLI